MASIAERRAAHLERAARREEEARTFTVPLDELFGILQQHGMNISTIDELVPIINEGVPLLNVRGKRSVDVPEFVKQARRYLAGKVEHDA